MADRNTTRPNSYHQISPPQYHGTSSAAPPSATPSHVPLSAAFSHQQPQSYTQSMSYPSESLPTASYQTTVPYQQPTYPSQSHQQPGYSGSMAAIGMAPMSTYQSYSPVPSIAYPDLMSAQGWDNMFSIPMEHDAMIFDVSQTYGLGIASPPSDVSTWDSPPPQ